MFEVLVVQEQGQFQLHWQLNVDEANLKLGLALTLIKNSTKFQVPCAQRCLRRL